MNSLRLEADEAIAKVEELQTKVKTLEQENLAKEQDITSLQHKNGLLEGEVEKLETAIKDFKKVADEGQEHGTQNETLQRRLQLLEEEAEEADKTLREANEKYVHLRSTSYHSINPLSYVGIVSTESRANMSITGSDKLMSRPATSSARSRPLRMNATSGSRSMRRWQRSTPICRRSWRSSRTRLETFKLYSLASIPFGCPTQTVVRLDPF